MIARISRKQKGIVDYLLSGKRADSNYTRDQKDNTVCLYGNINTLDKSIKYLYENKNYKDNYLHISISFSKNDIEKLNNMDEVQREAVLKDITESYIKHHTSGYDLQNEVIAYAEAHKPKIKINEKGNERLEHIHIVISKQNALSNTQLRTTLANTYIDETLQTYLNKKYNFDEPKNNKRTKETEKATLRNYYKNALSDIKKEEDLINYFETRKIKYKKVKTKRNEYYKIFLTNVKNEEVAINLRGKDFKNLEFIARNQEYTVHNELDELENTLKAFYAKRKIEITKRRSKLDNDKLKHLSYPTLSEECYISMSKAKIHNDIPYLKGYFTDTKNKDITTLFNKQENIKIEDKKDLLSVNYNDCNNKTKAVSDMLEIAIAKGWKLENLEVFGSDEFKKEAYKQIKQRLEQEQKAKELQQIKTIERAITPVQQNIKNMQDTEANNKTYSKEHLTEIKEKINLNEVLKYAQEHYKINIKDYELTKDNKINNITNKQKPKNVIDFFNKEIGLTIQESINISKEIYDEQQIKTNIDIKELKKELSKEFNKELPKYDTINNNFNIKGDKMYLSVCKNQNNDNTKNWEQVAVKSYEDLLNVVTNYHYSIANFKDNYRSGKNVESFNPLLIYDIDNDKDSPQLTMQEAQNLLKKHDIRALIVSTKSHKKEKNNHIAERFRILIPLQSPIQSTDKETYREIQKLISNDLGLTNYVDPMALNDTARSYYKTPISVNLEYKTTGCKNFLDITKYEEQAKINVEQEKQNYINKMENIKNKAIQETNKQISDYENYAYSNLINIVDYRAIVRNVDITKVITQFETLEKPPYSDSTNYLYYETKDSKYNIINLEEGGNLACDFKDKDESNKTYNVVTYLEKHLKTNNLTTINNYLNANGFGNYSKINTRLINRIFAKHKDDIYKIDDLAYHICNECIIKNPQKVTITKQDNGIHFKIFENEITSNENFAKKLEDTIKANNERLNKEQAKKEAEELAKKEAEELAKQQQQQVVSHTTSTKKKSKEWD